MEIRPYHKPTKYEYCHDEDDTDYDEQECEPECIEENECEMGNPKCPTDPDLFLLRLNAKGERKAIAFYLMASTKTSGPLCELFLDTARDEMLHFRRLMILLAKYDPVQCQAFKEAGINLQIDDLRKKAPTNGYCYQDRLEIIDLLTRSITDELEGINMYQESYEKACHKDVRALFCCNANDEKRHLAEFWKAIMIFTKEGTRPS